MPPKGRGHGKQKHEHDSKSLLRSKVQLDVRKSEINRWSEFQTSNGLSHLDDSIVIFKELLPMKLKSQSLNIDTGIKITDFNCTKDSPSGLVNLEINSTEKKMVKTYQKRIALMDPYRWMKYKERGTQQPFIWNFQPASLQSSENQAYIDIIGCALVTKIKKNIGSPHFCDLYGSLRAVADSFYYNL